MHSRDIAAGRAIKFAAAGCVFWQQSSSDIKVTPKERLTLLSNQTLMCSFLKSHFVEHIMKIIFSSSDNPARTCELCLEPMKFLGEQAECRLFRCNDCALVASETIMPASPSQALSLKRPSLWR